MFSLHSALIHTSKVKHSSVTVRRCKRNHGNVCKFFLFPHSSLHFRVLIDVDSSNKQQQRKFISCIEEKKSSLRVSERTLEYYYYYELEINANVICEVLRIFEKWNNFQDQPFPLSCPFSYNNCCVAFPIRYRSLISMPQPDGFNLKFLSYEFFSYI